MLEQVHLNDIDGPLADQALFLCGSGEDVQRDFAEADYYFTQIHERHPNSPLAPKAVELAIMAKHLSTGGSDYDGRKAAEARILVERRAAQLSGAGQRSGKAQNSWNGSCGASTMQQAEKDYKMAEFWERTGHPGVGVLPLRAGAAALSRTEVRRAATARMNEVAGGEAGRRPDGRDGTRRVRAAAATSVLAERRAAGVPEPVGRSRPPCLPQDSERKKRPQSRLPARRGEGSKREGLALRTCNPSRRTGETRRTMRLQATTLRPRAGRAAAGLSLAVALSLPACDSDGNFTVLGYTTRPNYDCSIHTVRVPIFKNRTFRRGMEFDLTRSGRARDRVKTPYKVVGPASRRRHRTDRHHHRPPRRILNFNQLNEIREARDDLDRRSDLARSAHAAKSCRKVRRPRGDSAAEPIVPPLPVRRSGTVPGVDHRAHRPHRAAPIAGPDVARPSGRRHTVPRPLHGLATMPNKPPVIRVSSPCRLHSRTRPVD